MAGGNELKIRVVWVRIPPSLLFGVVAELGLMHLFAKQSTVERRSGGSNPSHSAYSNKSKYLIQGLSTS